MPALSHRCAPATGLERRGGRHGPSPLNVAPHPWFPVGAGRSAATCGAFVGPGSWRCFRPSDGTRSQHCPAVGRSACREAMLLCDPGSRRGTRAHDVGPTRRPGPYRLSLALTRCGRGSLWRGIRRPAGGIAARTLRYRLYRLLNMYDRVGVGTPITAAVDAARARLLHDRVGQEHETMSPHRRSQVVLSAHTIWMLGGLREASQETTQRRPRNASAASVGSPSPRHGLRRHSRAPVACCSDEVGRVP